MLARRLHAHLRWRNTNSRHPDVLAAQRRERARIRAERQRRWAARLRPLLPDTSSPLCSATTTFHRGA